MAMKRYCNNKNNHRKKQMSKLKHDEYSYISKIAMI